MIREIPVGKDLRIENLSFKYDPLSEFPTLDNINLEIKAGKQTAVVGMSGSGKTTLVKLLLGFYPPASGQILLGDTPLENYSIREWRKQCGVVMQDGFIFSDSIAGNIAPGVEHIDKERLRHAAEVANIHGFIAELPLGYNTKIGQEGHGLSQGQKQRILIARAVYKNPEFIFFDEATNALDANNEREIMEHHHGEFAEIFRRKDISSGSSQAEYRQECRQDSSNRTGTYSRDGNTRGTHCKERYLLQVSEKPVGTLINRKSERHGKRRKRY